MDVFAFAFHIIGWLPFFCSARNGTSEAKEGDFVVFTWEGLV